MSTFHQAQHELKSRINMHLSELEGEYRVTFLEDQGTEKGEDVAYYTSDLQDAIRTAEIMRSVRKLKKIRMKTRTVSNDKRA